MKSILALACVIGLSGCSTLSPYLDKYEEASDKTFEAATAYKCEWVRMKVWLKHYGGSKAKAEAWRAECAPPNVELPVATDDTGQ